MPAVSEAQRRALYAKKGPNWMKKHHFDNTGPLPERVGKGNQALHQAALAEMRKRGSNRP